MKQVLVDLECVDLNQIKTVIVLKSEVFFANITQEGQEIKKSVLMDLVEID